MTPNVVLITGAASGFGRISAEALAMAGYTVYASMRGTAGHNAAQVAAIAGFAQTNGVDLRSVELDVGSQESVNAAIDHVLGESGRVDVVLHNAGHMSFGPAEAFTAEQMAQLYDINVVGTQRVNRAVLPHMRARRRGLLLWMSSSSAAGGTPPYLGPYFAAKAAMDALAVSYARELTLWGVETSIIVPGAFTSGTNQFANAAVPGDEDVAAAYEAGPYTGYGERIQKAFNELVPPEADPTTVADAVVAVVDAPFGKRPFRVHVDPSDDGGQVGFTVLDRLKAEMMHRTGLSELLHVAT
ncbi:SDR family NAD(P)-dependent oxidoreductase [Mycolicibacterium smegmatis]|uniref:SDR family NAD(P)-dependent oxidoreductase n=1 Tax=Mycolicibacterium smegmatis TaxID=1772 RepID=UPI0005D92D8D|nr:SDR family NAD(P)-dependent oxidoreductase [Mycolicibacterium smegmatis]MDF1899228.1 SDR family NAD(P)-dependent oxidoreductase [Mycolicibacterium smegmatis]MDF1904640.1 SDR family NAD(P)-dependent oxidoreductase [Mycolicibacterium smegmatis]MDF1918509.1 SDR family NAD(P)-dependent oxidoreductase [Mycolicibacterium smegmatis]MDF1923804.1 SDR family NAD(P)-dependent oxidoreductase [Mycolicibacterium smegmatis]UAK55574.1 SDR family NAD(P)-dependent oxidoreductase [Mycolicibacterium smegmatis]